MTQTKEKHGIARYNRGCRCEVCCAAKSEYNSKYRMPAEYWAGRRENPDYQSGERARNRKRQQTPERRAAKRSYGHTRRAILRGVTTEKVDPLVVFERDGYVCQRCGIQCDKEAVWPAADFPTLDHIVALANGGPHTYDNTQCLCLPCNREKGIKDFERLA
jgi:5-methylcytosine-specific restriction endonuclease McrA